MWYDFKCTGCGQIDTKQLPVDRRNDEFVCEHCGHTAVRDATPGHVNVTLKGFGWPSKDMKEKVIRTQHSALMGKKMRDNVASPKLVPNFGGKLTGTWADAQAAAHDAGKDASSYNDLVAKEKTGKSGSRLILAGN